MQRIEEIANQQKNFLESLNSFEKENIIKNLRHTGTICAFEIHTNENDNYLHNIGSQFTDYCLQNGVYLRALGNTIYIMPPYCITKKELRRVYSVAETFLQSIINKD